MEDGATVHIDNLAPAVLDLKDVLEEIRDELSSLHEESQNIREGLASLVVTVGVLRKVIEEVREALTPLHHLSTISNHLERLVREGR
jgi:prefoldin subunit 5